MITLLAFLLSVGLEPGGFFPPTPSLSSPPSSLSSPPSSPPVSRPSASPPSSHALLPRPQPSTPQRRVGTLDPSTPPPSTPLPSKPLPSSILLPTWRDLLGRSEKGTLSPTSQPSSELPLTQASFWVQLLSFFFLLGAFVAFLYLALRLLSSRLGVQPSAAHRVLSIQDRLALEPKKALFLIEVAGQYLLIASHEHGVTLLQTLDSAQVEKARLAGSSTPLSFWSLLRGKTTPPPAPSPNPSSPSPLPTHFEVVSDGRNKPPPSTDAG